MNSFKLFRHVLVAVLLITSFASCTKEKISDTEKTSSSLSFNPGPVDLQYGAIKGTVLPSGVNAILYLYGLQYSTKTATNPDGSFVFENIPEGKYLLNVVSTDSRFSDTEVSLAVSANNTTLLTIKLTQIRK